MIIQIVKMIIKLKITKILIFVRVLRFSKFIMKLIRAHNIEYEIETSYISIYAEKNFEGPEIEGGQIILTITGFDERYQRIVSLEKAIGELKEGIKENIYLTGNKNICIDLDEKCDNKRE